jgi:hypothetical protein
MIKAQSSYGGSQPSQGGSYQSVYNNQAPTPIEGNYSGFGPYKPKPAASKPKTAPGDVYSAKRAWKQSGSQGDWRAYMPGQQTGGYQNAPMPRPRSPYDSEPLRTQPSAPQDSGPYRSVYQPPQQQQGGFDATYGQIGGGYGSTPNFGQRDAFINNINNTMSGYQANQGTYLGDGAPPASWGQTPQFNFPGMWQQAGDMVQSGWKNPLLGLMG